MKRGLDKLIGMRREKARARIDILACKRAREVFPHTLLEGVGGTGKTALALAIAEELNYYSVITEAAALKTREQIIKRLSGAHDEANSENKHLLLFVDEVHRLSIVLQEVFYYPMDRKEPRITVPTGVIHFKPFTLMAATTRRDELDQASFVKRFGNIWRVERYDEGDIMRIIKLYFNAQKIRIDYRCCEYLASRSLGIPRQALRLAEKARNVCLASMGHQLTLAHCQTAIRLEGIDPAGLDELSVHYLQILSESPSPRGLGGLAGRLGQQADMIEGTVEPILLELSFVDRTAKGRMITCRGKRHLERFHKISS
jgi:Holliday junction DNA helicase RuvB